MYLEVFSNSII